MRRVVITGMAGITSQGSDWETIRAAFESKRNGIVYMDAWDCYEGLGTRLGGPIPCFTKPKHFSRKQTRSMGRVALMSTAVTEQALIDAGLQDNPIITDGRMGVAYGSSSGSTSGILDFGRMMLLDKPTAVTATSYIRMMNHTTAVNIGVFFQLKGRVIPTSSACTSGSQAIGYAYEAIRFGMQDIMVAGGAEELCPTQASVFDTLYATSQKNDAPQTSPRPFDKDRDGLVVGEGAGTLILEELEHAKARGATIYAEVVGFGTNSDGSHITQPETNTMQVAMELALKDAALAPEAIGYVNAHGTATDRGDVAESLATNRVFGSRMPISSLKSYWGHTLGACGALEAWMSIEMLNSDWYAPTLNLQTIDPLCGELDYIQSEGRSMQNSYVMSNNFAFGGINTSLIFKRW
ncbi:MAG: beta-ketoacyl-ACP synthase II [Kangiellaceae bacterium]|nr:beta-ketoacyl-ACP synthase II [Kangiellaceae bacterium]